MDEARVLSDPAEACARGQGALQHRTRIHIGPRAHRTLHQGLEPRRDAFQLLEQDVVVVLAARVARHPAA